MAQWRTTQRRASSSRSTGSTSSAGNSTRNADERDREARYMTRRATRLAACAVFQALLAACGSTAPDVDHNAVARVDVVPATATLFLGTSNVILLGAVARNSAGVELTGKAANWRSTSTSVATVSAGGDVTAVS